MWILIFIFFNHIKWFLTLRRLYIWFKFWFFLINRIKGWHHIGQNFIRRLKNRISIFFIFTGHNFDFFRNNFNFNISRSFFGGTSLPTSLPFFLIRLLASHARIHRFTRGLILLLLRDSGDEFFHVQFSIIIQVGHSDHFV